MPYVPPPLFQRWQANGDDVEAEEQILTELPLLDGSLEIDMASGDDPDVGLDRRRLAQGVVLLGLQQLQQSRLPVAAHAVDVVQEERTVLGRCYQPSGCPARPR